MSRLFIHAYLDEDVDVLIAKLIRARGFEAATAHEAGRVGRTDSEQLSFAAEQRMALLTHNRVDFERLAAEYLAAGRSHAGIVIAVRQRPHEIAGRLLRILNLVTADAIENQIRYI